MITKVKTCRAAVTATIVVASCLGCSPASISRIGLGRPPKPEGCPVEVLAPGESPDRPHVDIGVVALSNCQEYTSRPCRTWLEKAVCELGGEVAYLPDPKPPQNEIDAVNYRIIVAVFAGGEPPDEGLCKEPDSDAAAEPSEPEKCLE